MTEENGALKRLPAAFRGVLDRSAGSGTAYLAARTGVMIVVLSGAEAMSYGKGYGKGYGGWGNKGGLFMAVGVFEVRLGEGLPLLLLPVGWWQGLVALLALPGGRG